MSEDVATAGEVKDLQELVTERFPDAEAVAEFLDSVRPQLPPPNGWLPAHFPQITVDHIPYTTSPEIRPDPNISITPQGWLFMDVGNVRIALPDEEEWLKLVYMVGAMWNDWRNRQPPTDTEDTDESSQPD